MSEHINLEFGPFSGKKETKLNSITIRNVSQVQPLKKEDLLDENRAAIRVNASYSITGLLNRPMTGALDFNVTEQDVTVARLVELAHQELRNLFNEVTNTV